MMITLVMKTMIMLMIKIFVNFKQNCSHHTDADSLKKISVALHYNKCYIPPVNMNKEGIMHKKLFLYIICYIDYYSIFKFKLLLNFEKKIQYGHQATFKTKENQKFG